MIDKKNNINMKRNIFLISSALTWLLPFTILIFHFWVPGIFLIFLLELVIYLIIQMLIVILIHNVRGGRLPDLFDFHFFFGGLYTLKFKRIYYSELGYFYINKSDDEIKIFEQNYLYMERIGSVNYNGDIEDLKKSIKRKLEDHYKEYMKSKQESDKLKNWSGSLDIQSERDDKINKILN